MRLSAASPTDATAGHRKRKGEPGQVGYQFSLLRVRAGRLRAGGREVVEPGLVLASQSSLTSRLLVLK